MDVSPAVSDKCGTDSTSKFRIRPLSINSGTNVDIIPSPVKLPITTLGFIEPYNPEAFLANFEQIANELTYIAVAAFSITEEGYAYVLLRDQEIVVRSKKLNVSPLLMIRNFRDGEFSPEIIGNILENPLYRNHLVTSLVNLVRTRGYEGVSIDFEFVPPERRR